MTALVHLWRNPVLRLATGLMLMTGTMWASFGPYIALLAVNTFRLGDRGYAVVLVVSTLLGVLASVAIGIRADQKASRRRIALVTSALGVAGLALMVLAPGQPSFVLLHAVLLPVSSTLFGQIFTLARLAAADLAPDQRQIVTSALRAAVSLPFVILLPLWSVALGRGVALTTIYPVTLVFSVAMLALIYRFWPQDARAGWEDKPSGLSLRAALRELAQPALALRLCALGAVASMPTLYVMSIALILTQIGHRPASDPGLFFGFVAGGEVPAMLIMPLAARFIGRLWLIVAGAVLSGGFLLAVPLLAASPWVWALILPLAMAHGVLLTLPITYLQDLLANRPGTGTALMSLQGLIGNGLAAAAFALGTAISGYPMALVLGAATGLAGALVLVWADRATPAQPRATA